MVDDELIPIHVLEIVDREASPTGKEASSPLPALDIAELIPDFGDGSEAGETVDLSALFAEDVDGEGSDGSFDIADVGAGAGDSFALTFPAALPGLDDIPGDGGIF